MTMGTASTMASMVEALGVSLPGNAAIPAVDSRRYRLAQLSGRRIVEMVHEDLVLSKILTRQAFENAIKANAAIGGSTNSVVHLLAIAGRLGVKLELDDWDKLGSQLPCLVNLQPSGKYLMEDFYYAGGLPAVLREIAHVLNTDALTANGKTMGENIAERAVLESRRHQGVRRAVQGQRRHRDPARQPRARWRGHQAVGRHAQTTQASRAARWCSRPSKTARRASTTRISTSTRTASWCSRAAARRVIPGMAEVGNMPLPPKILRKGITDMVRISDARMSGTAYGTVVLHVAPEAAAGGPLALVQDRRHHRARRAGAQAAPRRERRRAREAPRGLEGARGAQARLLQAVRRARAAGRQGRGPRLPGRRQRHHRHARQSLRADAHVGNAVEAARCKLSPKR